MRIVQVILCPNYCADMQLSLPYFRRLLMTFNCEVSGRYEIDIARGTALSRGIAESIFIDGKVRVRPDLLQLHSAHCAPLGI